MKNILYTALLITIFFGATGYGQEPDIDLEFSWDRSFGNDWGGADLGCGLHAMRTPTELDAGANVYLVGHLLHVDVGIFALNASATAGDGTSEVATRGYFGAWVGFDHSFETALSFAHVWQFYIAGGGFDVDLFLVSVTAEAGIWVAAEINMNLSVDPNAMTVMAAPYAGVCALTGFELGFSVFGFGAGIGGRMIFANAQIGLPVIYGADDPMVYLAIHGYGIGFDVYTYEKTWWETYEQTLYHDTFFGYHLTFPLL